MKSDEEEDGNYYSPLYASFKFYDITEESHIIDYLTRYIIAVHNDETIIDYYGIRLDTLMEKLMIGDFSIGIDGPTVIVMKKTIV